MNVQITGIYNFSFILGRKFRIMSKLNGIGISLGLSRLTNNVAIGGGGTISFVFWNNYWRQASLFVVLFKT